MRVLITNDDGINAIGLKKLVEATIKYAKVIVVAPKVEQSAKSHSIRVRDYFEFKKIDDIVEGVDTYYVDSTPADCVRVAYFYLHDEFDIVFSGVNKGFNVGEDITYSGTCAAATEGALLKRKGIAFSTDYEDCDKIDNDLNIAMEYIFENKLYEKWDLWNINIPYQSKEFKYVRQGFTHYISNYENKDGYLRSIGRPEATPDDIEYSDVDSVYKKYITIMPLTFDRTNEEVLKKFIK